MKSYWFRFGRPHDWLMHAPTYNLDEALRKRRGPDKMLFIYAWNGELVDVLDCADVLKFAPEERLFRRCIQRMIDDVKATEAFQ